MLWSVVNPKPGIMRYKLTLPYNYRKQVHLFVITHKSCIRMHSLTECIQCLFFAKPCLLISPWEIRLLFFKCLRQITCLAITQYKATLLSICTNRTFVHAIKGAQHIHIQGSQDADNHKRILKEALIATTPYTYRQVMRHICAHSATIYARRELPYMTCD